MVVQLLLYLRNRVPLQAARNDGGGMSDAVDVGNQAAGRYPPACSSERTQLFRRCRLFCLADGPAVFLDVIQRHVAALRRIYLGKIPHDRIYPTSTRLFQRQVPVMGRVRRIEAFLHGPAAVRGGGIRRRTRCSRRRLTRTGSGRLREDWTS